MKKLLSRIVIFSLVAFSLWNLYSYFNPSMDTLMVTTGQMSDSDSYDCIIIRDETVVNTAEDGTFQAFVNENEIVKKNKLIAAVYKQDIDQDVQQKLNQVNDRITEITNSQKDAGIYSGDRYKIETQLSTKVSDTIVSINNANILNVYTLKKDINSLLDKKLAMTGEAEVVSSTLASLREEKANYENTLNSAKLDLYSPQSGVFSASIDGFESILNSAAAKKMTAADYKTVDKTSFSKQDIKSGQAVCKIIDNFSWSAAVCMKKTAAEKYKVGNNVYLRLKNHEDEFSATVSYISNESGKECVVVFTSTRFKDYMYSERKTEIEVIKSKYSGFKVPTEAIRVKNGVTGVYTVTEGLMKFKKADVLYNDEEYAIIKEDNSVTGGVLLYDEVVISAKQIAEGIIVR